MNSPRYVTRSGDKLAAALTHFNVNVAGAICADLGSHAGGFVDCLLQAGAARVYSIDTSYGTLSWKLRKDPRVVVMERQNAMHVALPENVDLITIDVGWTRQAAVLPNVARMLRPGGIVLTLIKPHYEAPPEALQKGVLPALLVPQVVASVCAQMQQLGWIVQGTLESPIAGHAGNREVFAALRRAS